VIQIDGVEYAGKTMIVAAGITADGTKRVLGLRQGATEDAAMLWHHAELERRFSEAYHETGYEVAKARSRGLRLRRGADMP
jgi:hypothetical protein